MSRDVVALLTNAPQYLRSALPYCDEDFFNLNIDMAGGFTDNRLTVSPKIDRILAERFWEPEKSQQ